MSAEWQPIWTAPRDGTQIIVPLSGDDVEIVCFSGGQWVCRDDLTPLEPPAWMPMPPPFDWASLPLKVV